MEIIKTKLIQIGNSKGIRIPKQVLDRLDIHNRIELIIDDDTKQIHIKSLDQPRKDWDKAFQKMHELQEDELLISDELDLKAWDW